MTEKPDEAKQMLRMIIKNTYLPLPSNGIRDAL